MVRQAILPETAATLNQIMQRVVTDGTGRNARLVSYSVAGKTGTADKLVNGRYSGAQQNVSFVGFVPAQRPELTVIVMVDSPRVGGDTGGAIAAPIFKRIADASLRYLGTTPTINPAPPVIVARNQPTTVTQASMPAERSVIAMPAHMTEAGLPDLRGMSAREALRELARVGLTAKMQGTGVVVEQDPPAGISLRTRRVVHPRPESPPGSAAHRSPWRSAVTLGDVVDALRHLVVDAPPAGLASDRAITAVAYDSRRVVAGSVFVALKGLRADGGAFTEQAASRGAIAVVSESAAPEGFAIPWLTVTRRAPCARAARRSLFRSPEPAHAGHRRHRHEREDDHGLPARLDPRCGGSTRWNARNRRVSHWRRGPRSLAHHARVA